MKIRIFVLWSALSVFGACNLQTGKNQYILAERLFSDQKYKAAVQEYQKIIDADARGLLAQQSMFRIGIIEQIYLEDYVDAVRAYRQFTLTSRNRELIYQAEKNIGEIYFTKLEDHRSSIEQYKRILENFPDSSEKDFFLYRIGKSYYGALEFQKAIEVYKELINKFPNSLLIVEAQYQLANTLSTRGDCDIAITEYKKVMINYPNSKEKIFAAFGLASCYEELEKYVDALDAYTQILDKYPQKNIIDTKIKRLNSKIKRK